MGAVWITGGKGFIGRHLARHAADEGAAVFGIGHGLWPQEDAAGWSIRHWVNGEIEPFNLGRLAGISGVPDAVFHLAGGSSVGQSLQSPQEDFSRTVETTARLLEWVRVQSRPIPVVCVSSAAVYGTGHRGRISESAAGTPFSPYGYHKSMMEGLCRSYAESFGLSVAVVRLFSVYGEGLEKQLIWDICCKLRADDRAQLVLGGTGREVRDWIHVSDAARLLFLAARACRPECPVVNGGAGEGTAVAEVARTVCEAWGVPAEVRFNGVSRPGDPESLVADIVRAASMGFAPQVSFGRGIARTVEWFRTRKADEQSFHVR